MGCCQSAQNRNSGGSFSQRLRESIEHDNIKALQDLFKSVDQNNTKSAVNVDEPMIAVKKMQFSALAYALYLGKVEVFKYLAHHLDASIQEAMQLLARQSISPLDLICAKGYTDLLEDVIPIYLSAEKGSILAQEEVSVDFNTAEQYNAKVKSTYTAIHVACNNGHINVISYVHNYFKTQPYCPVQLDIDYQDELTGENCALISARNGNYAMMKFLHEQCKANFCARNKRNENAVQIAAVNSKKKANLPYLECIAYLIDTIGIDFAFAYEEILLVVENKQIIQYFESKLNSYGISDSKAEIENRNKILKSSTPRSQKEIDLEQLLETPDFDMRKYIEEDDDKRSIISSICQIESRPSTPFISFMELKEKSDSQVNFK
ncbi:unnamed protein product [Blepharisma stoltei]|uniref:Uncharacterized protein n=1 Tax=Blepharisma stoltei TaxID=1481888 RepID=A0AAU9JF47_9CILI|nr:unnamed protein product [Blepharisma stoltei]